ncbi:hypothetical protein DCO58_08860 [Helicobacter saguini]|uniref:UDP-4-amino-4, 6-dideoxy-N-acetyl-beta-L-altrosamine transaminase n=1 Tax=Helicobacter saguini TaxID=1548018 RepID=A0A347VLH4_9HELI|nr:DegT/DnrJ/EryC1/StrS family aminotransferase [Helicobacter saguini]MWV61569.1 hypothetical protein [Helicobacter saguini]MWV67760.1 hypothetical protein [Helicobacter saguini]MWV70772.1 hypothetical protein [Helicobacter saguini]MWV72676.1 hypothetical protein [Helicobacter saguini]TLD94521.1 hypothetical protein LS64_004960 [Helicobacter saguini]
MLEKFLPYSTQSIDDSDILSVTQALKSSHLTQGAQVKKFEDSIASFVGVGKAIAFNSATSALYAAFRGVKDMVYNADFVRNLIKDSKDCLDSKILRLMDAPNFASARKKKKISIITTPISFVATTNMMLENDITPIFVDIEMNGNINTAKIESALQDDTLAICSVDYAGNSVDVVALRKLCEKHNLLFISDSSHAFGATFQGEKVGSFADVSIFSFHAVKPIATCEGGALVTNSNFFATLAGLVCSHGVVKKSLFNYDCITLGFNFRMNEISAALGLSQMKRLQSFITQREKIAQFYNEYFKGNPFFFTPDSIKTQDSIKVSRNETSHSVMLSKSETSNLNKSQNLDSKNPNNIESNRQDSKEFIESKKPDSKEFIESNFQKTQSTRHLYPLLLDPKYVCSKEQIANDLNAQNVGVQVHYKPIYNFSAYQKFNYPLLRNAEDFYHAELSIPCHQNMDLNLAKQTADIILKTFEKLKY